MAPRLRFNEGKACDAILRRLEAREGARRTNLRSPERERHPAPVELACEIGDRLFAIEHTGIEPFSGHMQLEAEAGVHFRPIEAMVAGRLPPDEHFELHMPVKATQGLKGSALRRVHEIIASWIIATAPTLPIARFGRYVTPIRWVTLPGVPFPVTLHRTTTEGFPARFTIHHRVEANHEAERVKRIREACQRKYPKLARWKRDHGARTVLVLEENDIQLTNQQVVADALLEVEQTMPDRPDEVYLVSTAVETPWWTLKRSTHISRRQSSGAMYGIIRSEPVSFQISLPQYTGRLVSLDNQISQKKFWFLPYRCGDQFIRITWCAWIAATGERRYVGTSARGTG